MGGFTSFVPLECVSQTMWTLTPAFRNLPLPVRTLVGGMLWLRVATSGKRYLNAYTNSDNVLPLAASWGADRIASKLGLEAVAYWTLVSERVLQCVEQANVIAKAWHQLCNVATGKYPTPRHYVWIAEQKSSFFSVSTVVWMKNKKDEISDRTQLFVRVLFAHLLWEIGHLVVRMIDTAVILSLKPSETHPLRMLMVDYLNNDKRLLLLEKFQKNESAIKSLLEKLKVPYAYEDLKQVATPVAKVAQVFTHQRAKSFGDRLLANVASLGLLPKRCVTPSKTLTQQDSVAVRVDQTYSASPMGKKIHYATLPGELIIKS